MILYHTIDVPVVEHDGLHYPIDQFDWDTLLNRDDLSGVLAEVIDAGAALPEDYTLSGKLLPPVGTQEVWAAGVTYYRSRTARMEESEGAGGSSFYDRVYQADRPELFLKATPHRVVGHEAEMHLRGDSKWIVPEPELTLVVTRGGKIIGYTVGNDLSCRDIEGENPLYLPQAKTFNACAAVGPGILVGGDPLPPETQIRLDIGRGGSTVFSGSTELAQLKKTPEALVQYLYRDNTFPSGCLLMTGTGIVPPDDFTLQARDVVHITIGGIGRLTNTMA